MILSLGWNCLASPMRVRGCLGMADVYGPGSRQRDFFKHRSVMPSIATLDPKFRLINPVLLDPLPTSVVPEGTFLVSAGLHELKELIIRHVESINPKLRHKNRVFLEFVIPSE